VTNNGNNCDCTAAAKYQGKEKKGSRVLGSWAPGLVAIVDGKKHGRGVPSGEMGADDEDLDDNPFLVALKSRAPDLYRLAGERQLVIACPRAAATGALSLNRTCFETHILSPSPFFAGVYECLNSSKTVDLDDDGVIETQEGFLERRKVKVLNEDLHYNSEYKPFRVLCISQALEGGGRVVEERRRRGGGAAEVQGNNLEECRTAFLALDMQDVSPLTQRAASAVRNFFLTYKIFAKGYLHVVSGKFNDLLDRAAQELIAANRQSLDEFRPGSKKWPFFRRVVTTVLLKDTRISGGGGAREVGVDGDADTLMCAHDRLYDRVREAYREEDSLVLLAAAHKRQYTPSEMGADKNIQCDLSEAMKKMSALYSLPCALDKVAALRQVSEAITAAVERGVADGSIPPHVKVGSDDLLPLFIYVVVQSAAAHLHDPATISASGAAGAMGATGAAAPGGSSLNAGLGAAPPLLAAAANVPQSFAPHASALSKGAPLPPPCPYATAQLMQHFGLDSSDPGASQSLFDIATFQVPFSPTPSPPSVSPSTLHPARPPLPPLRVSRFLLHLPTPPGP